MRSASWRTHSREAQQHHDPYVIVSPKASPLRAPPPVLDGFAERHPGSGFSAPGHLHSPAAATPGGGSAAREALIAHLQAELAAKDKEIHILQIEKRAAERRVDATPKRQPAAVLPPGSTPSRDPSASAVGTPISEAGGGGGGGARSQLSLLSGLIHGAVQGDAVVSLQGDDLDSVLAALRGLEARLTAEGPAGQAVAVQDAQQPGSEGGWLAEECRRLRQELGVAQEQLRLEREAADEVMQASPRPAEVACISEKLRQATESIRSDTDNVRAASVRHEADRQTIAHLQQQVALLQQRLEQAAAVEVAESVQSTATTPPPPPSSSIAPTAPTPLTQAVSPAHLPSPPPAEHQHAELLQVIERQSQRIEQLERSAVALGGQVGHTAVIGADEYDGTNTTCSEGGLEEDVRQGSRGEAQARATGPAAGVEVVGGACGQSEALRERDATIQSLRIRLEAVTSLDDSTRFASLEARMAEHEAARHEAEEENKQLLQQLVAMQDAEDAADAATVSASCASSANDDALQRQVLDQAKKLKEAQAREKQLQREVETLRRTPAPAAAAAGPGPAQQQPRPALVGAVSSLLVAQQPAVPTTPVPKQPPAQLLVGSTAHAVQRREVGPVPQPQQAQQPEQQQQLQQRVAELEGLLREAEGRAHPRESPGQVAKPSADAARAAELEQLLHASQTEAAALRLQATQAASARAHEDHQRRVQDLEQQLQDARAEGQRKASVDSPAPPAAASQPRPVLRAAGSAVASPAAPSGAVPPQLVAASVSSASPRGKLAPGMPATPPTPPAADTAAQAAQDMHDLQERQDAERKKHAAHVRGLEEALAKAQQEAEVAAVAAEAAAAAEADVPAVVGLPSLPAAPLLRGEAHSLSLQVGGPGRQSAGGGDPAAAVTPPQTPPHPATLEGVDTKTRDILAQRDKAFRRKERGMSQELERLKKALKQAEDGKQHVADELRKMKVERKELRSTVESLCIGEKQLLSERDHRQACAGEAAKRHQEDAALQEERVQELEKENGELQSRIDDLLAQDAARSDWHSAQLGALQSEAARIRQHVDNRISEHLRKAEDTTLDNERVRQELDQAMQAMNDLRCKSAESERTVRAQLDDIVQLREKMGTLMSQLDATQSELAGKTRDLHTRRQEIMRLKRSGADDLAELRRQFDAQRAEAEEKVLAEAASRVKLEQRVALSDQQLDMAKEKAEQAQEAASAAQAESQQTSARVDELTALLEEEQEARAALADAKRDVCDQLAAAQAGLAESEEAVATLRMSTKINAFREAQSLLCAAESEARGTTDTSSCALLFDIACEAHTALAAYAAGSATQCDDTQTALDAQQSANDSLTEQISERDAALSLLEMQIAKQQEAHAEELAAIRAASTDALCAAAEEASAKERSLQDDIAALQGVAQTLEQVQQEAVSRKGESTRLLARQKALKGSFDQLRVKLLERDTNLRLTNRYFAVLALHREFPTRRAIDPATLLVAHQRGTILHWHAKKPESNTPAFQTGGSDAPPVPEDEPQALSAEPRTLSGEPPALRHAEPHAPSDKPQTLIAEPETLSDKPHAPSDKPKAISAEPQTLSDKPRALSGHQETVKAPGFREHEIEALQKEIEALREEAAATEASLQNEVRRAEDLAEHSAEELRQSAASRDAIVNALRVESEEHLRNLEDTKGAMMQLDVDSAEKDTVISRLKAALASVEGEAHEEKLKARVLTDDLELAEQRHRSTEAQLEISQNELRLLQEAHDDRQRGLATERQLRSEVDSQLKEVAEDREALAGELEHMRERLHTSAEEVDSARSDLAVLMETQSTLSDSRTAQEHLAKQLVCSQEEIALCRRRLATEFERRQGKEAEITTLKQQVVRMAELREAVEALEHQLREEGTLRMQERHRLALAEQQRDEAQQRQGSATEELQAVQEQLREACAEAEAAQAALDDTQQKLGRSDRALVDSSRALMEAGQREAALHASHAEDTESRDEEILLLKEQLDVLERVRLEYEDDMADFRRQNKVLLREKEALGVDLQTLQAGKAAVLQELEAAQAAEEAGQGQIKNLNAALEEVGKLLQQREGDLQEAQAQAARRSEELDAAAEKGKELGAALKASEKQAKKLKGEVAKAKEGIEAAEARAGDLSQALQQLREDSARAMDGVRREKDDLRQDSSKSLDAERRQKEDLRQESVRSLEHLKQQHARTLEGVKLDQRREVADVQQQLQAARADAEAQKAATASLQQHADELEAREAAVEAQLHAAHEVINTPAPVVALHASSSQYQRCAEPWLGEAEMESVRSPLVAEAALLQAALEAQQRSNAALQAQLADKLDGSAVEAGALRASLGDLEHALEESNRRNTELEAQAELLNERCEAAQRVGEAGPAEVGAEGALASRVEELEQQLERQQKMLAQRAAAELQEAADEIDALRSHVQSLEEGAVAEPVVRLVASEQAMVSRAVGAATEEAPCHTSEAAAAPATPAAQQQVVETGSAMYPREDAPPSVATTHVPRSAVRLYTFSASLTQAVAVHRPSRGGDMASGHSPTLSRLQGVGQDGRAEELQQEVDALRAALRQAGGTSLPAHSLPQLSPHASSPQQQQQHEAAVGHTADPSLEEMNQQLEQQLRHACLKGADVETKLMEAREQAAAVREQLEQEQAQQKAQWAKREEDTAALRVHGDTALKELCEATEKLTAAEAALQVAQSRVAALEAEGLTQRGEIKGMAAKLSSLTDDADAMRREADSRVHIAEAAVERLHVEAERAAVEIHEAREERGVVAAQLQAERAANAAAEEQLQVAETRVRSLEERLTAAGGVSREHQILCNQHEGLAQQHATAKASLAASEDQCIELRSEGVALKERLAAACEALVGSEEQSDSLQAALAEKENELEDLAEAEEEQRELVAELQKGMGEMKGAIEEMAACVADKDAELDSKERAICSRDSQIEALNTQLQSLETEHAASLEEVAALIEQSAAADERIAAADERAAAAEDLAGTTTDELDEAARTEESLSSQLRATTQRADTVTAERTALQAQADDLDVALAAERSTVEQLQQQRSVLEDDLAHSTAQNSDLQAALDTATAAVGQLRGDLAAAEAKAVELQGCVEEKLNDVHMLRSTIDELEASQAAAEAERDTLRQEVEVAKATVQQAEASAAHTQRDITSLRQEMASLQQELADAHDATAAANTKVSEGTREVDRLQSAVERAKSRAVEAEQRYEEAAFQVNALRTQLSEKSSELERVRRELAFHSTLLPRGTPRRPPAEPTPLPDAVETSDSPPSRMQRFLQESQDPNFGCD